MLRELGFSVTEELFSYSAFPGRFATPLVGAVLGAAIVAAGMMTRGGHARAALVALLIIGGGASVFARWMLVSGVLDAPWMRAESRNLVATRGPGMPRVWLVAHLDSKSQPVPSAVRVGGVTVLAVALVLAAAGAMMSVAGHPSPAVVWSAIACGIVGAVPVMASVVGARSDGAVDNASGVAAVLAAAGLVPQGTPLGVLLPSAEELGLGGARAWVRSRAVGIALNCDGVDDGGTLVLMHNRPAPVRVLAVLEEVAYAAHVAPVRAHGMPLGLLTDSTAFASAGWGAVTVSHGSLETLRRVHTSRDSLENLQGASIGRVADVLARAVVALAV